MTLQMKAERERRAPCSRPKRRRRRRRKSRGIQARADPRGRSRKESALRDAEARERLAQAEANAITSVAGALKSPRDPLMYLLGQEYVKGLVRLGESQNSKMVILPADLIDSVRKHLQDQGVMGGPARPCSREFRSMRYWCALSRCPIRSR